MTSQPDQSVLWHKIQRLAACAEEGRFQWPSRCRSLVVNVRSCGFRNRIRILLSTPKRLLDNELALRLNRTGVCWAEKPLRQSVKTAPATSQNLCAEVLGSQVRPVANSVSGPLPRARGRFRR